MRATPLNARALAPSTDRCLAILELLSRRSAPPTLSAIHRELGISKNMVFRILADLEARGYIGRDAEKGYFLGGKLLELAAPRAAGHNLVDEAAPIVRALRDECGESAGLMVPGAADAVLVYFQPSRHTVRTIFDPGFRVALYCNAPGKVFLAFGDEAERLRRLRRQTFKRRTARTIIRRDVLEEELATARRRGYTVDRGEDAGDAHCVAAPVFDGEDRLVAALVVTGPRDRIPEAKFAVLGRQTAVAAARLTARLKL